MKVFTKIVAAAILSLAALGIMSCDMLQNAGRTGGDTPNPQKINDEATVKTVKDALTVQGIVGKAQNKIILPKGGEGVTVTWKSNPDLIDSEGNVTHKDGTGFDEVELTATITKGEASVKKTFKVKVAQKNKELSLDELLDSVTIPVDYDKTKYEVQEIDVQESILVEDKTVTIEYTSSNDYPHLRYDSYTKKIIIHRDIADVTAQLSVKLTCEGKEKTKQITVLIERIPEFVYLDYSGNKATFTFDGTTLTKANSSPSKFANSKFAYTADTNNRIITVSKTHAFRNGKFLDKEKALNADIEPISKYISDIKEAYKQPNLENLRVLFNYRDANLKNDDEVIDYILKDEKIRKHFEGMTETSTKDDFKALLEDKKKKGIKNFCEEEIKEGVAYYNISDALPFLEMLKKVEAAAIAEIRKEISKEFFTNIKYKYKVSSESYKARYPKGVWFEAKRSYDENRNWYENSNCGHWDKIQIVNGEWELDVYSDKYYGNFNSDYSEFSYSKKWDNGIGKLKSESGKWIFEKPDVDTDGNVSMKAKKNGSPDEVSLTFYPEEL